ncbi:MAG: pseudouridine synthase [bacterium]
MAKQKKVVPVVGTPRGVFPMRINKYLAWKNLCTRREADTYVGKGQVLLNGTRAVLGDQVQETDTVEVRFRTKQYRYFAYHKPRGIITHSPGEGEEDIKAVVPTPGVFPIGRLDKDSSGLMILTDDGRLTDKLLNPDFAHEKEYIVRVKEPLQSNFQKRIEPGVNIEGHLTKPCTVKVLGENKFSIVLTEGKKHQIRRMCAALGYVVSNLERRRIMNINLDKLKPGEHRALSGKELSDFLKALGF